MNNGEIIIYETQDGQTSIDVKMEGETVWLSQAQMAELFGRDEKTVRKHINNVFREKELDKEINTHFLRVDGVMQPVHFLHKFKTWRTECRRKYRQPVFCGRNHAIC